MTENQQGDAADDVEESHERDKRPAHVGNGLDASDYHCANAYGHDYRAVER